VLCSCYHYHNHVHYMGLSNMAAMIYETKWQIKFFDVTEQRSFKGGFQQFYNDWKCSTSASSVVPNFLDVIARKHHKLKPLVCLWVMRRDKIAIVCSHLVEVCRHTRHWYRCMDWKLSIGSYDSAKLTATVASMHWSSLDADQTNQPSSKVSYLYCLYLACRGRKIALMRDIILNLRLWSILLVIVNVNGPIRVRNEKFIQNFSR